MKNAPPLLRYIAITSISIILTGCFSDPEKEANTLYVKTINNTQKITLRNHDFDSMYIFAKAVEPAARKIVDDFSSTTIAVSLASKKLSFNGYSYQELVSNLAVLNKYVPYTSDPQLSFERLVANATTTIERLRYNFAYFVFLANKKPKNTAEIDKYAKEIMKTYIPAEALFTQSFIGSVIDSYFKKGELDKVEQFISLRTQICREANDVECVDLVNEPNIFMEAVSGNITEVDTLLNRDSVPFYELYSLLNAIIHVTENDSSESIEPIYKLYQKYLEILLANEQEKNQHESRLKIKLYEAGAIARAGKPEIAESIMNSISLKSSGDLKVMSELASFLSQSGLKKYLENEYASLWATVNAVEDEIEEQGYFRDIIYLAVALDKKEGIDWVLSKTRGNAKEGEGFLQFFEQYFGAEAITVLFMGGYTDEASQLSKHVALALSSENGSILEDTILSLIKVRQYQLAFEMKERSRWEVNQGIVNVLLLNSLLEEYSDTGKISFNTLFNFERLSGVDDFAHFTQLYWTD